MPTAPTLCVVVSTVSDPLIVLPVVPRTIYRFGRNLRNLTTTRVSSGTVTSRVVTLLPRPLGIGNTTPVEVMKHLVYAVRMSVVVICRLIPKFPILSLIVLTTLIVLELLTVGNLGPKLHRL